MIHETGIPARRESQLGHGIDRDVLPLAPREENRGDEEKQPQEPPRTLPPPCLRGGGPGGWGHFSWPAEPLGAPCPSPATSSAVADVAGSPPGA